jgi:CobQ-like glutamine amidotransferase family enzyme
MRALNIFDYKSEQVNYRISKEVNAKSNITLLNVIGFINQNSVSLINDNHLFNYNNINDGYRFKNFYATNILGPILVRNPHLLIYIVEKILNTKITNNNLTLELNAYNSFITKYNKEKKTD